MKKETEVLKSTYVELNNRSLTNVASFLICNFNWSEQKSLRLFKRTLKIILENEGAENRFDYYIPRQDAREAFLVLHEKELEKMN